MLLHRAGTKNLHHPVAGDLDLTYEAFELPSEPGLRMLVCTAEPNTPTAQALGFLASWAATQHTADETETAPTYCRTVPGGAVVPRTTSFGGSAVSLGLRFGLSSRSTTALTASRAIFGMS